jgi:hypothetical protein
VAAGFVPRITSVDNRLARFNGTTGAVQGSGITVDDSNNVTGVAAITASGTVAASGRIATTDQGTSSNRGVQINQHNNGAQAAILQTVKSRGTAVSPTSVQTNDLIGFWTQSPYDGSVYMIDPARMGFAVTGSPATGSVPMSFGIRTGATAGQYNPTFYVHHSGSVGIGDFGSFLSGLTQPETTLEVRGSGLFTGNLTASGTVGVGTYTVATLPSASANAGRMTQVTDSSVTTNGSAVAGGGSNRVLLFSNGTTWDVVVA